MTAIESIRLSKLVSLVTSTLYYKVVAECKAKNENDSRSALPVTPAAARSRRCLRFQMSMFLIAKNSFGDQEQGAEYQNGRENHTKCHSQQRRWFVYMQ